MARKDKHIRAGTDFVRSLQIFKQDFFKLNGIKLSDKEATNLIGKRMLNRRFKL